MPPIKLELTESQADTLADVLEYYKMSDYGGRDVHASLEDRAHVAEVKAVDHALRVAQYGQGVRS